jgi:hypothetical protein
VWHFDEANDALVAYGPDGRQQVRILVRPLEPQLRPTGATMLERRDVQVLELRADRLGRAWVEMVRESMGDPRRWWVFDAEGRWVAEARTPPVPKAPMEIGPDHVLFLESDADGMQTVSYCPVRTSAR